MYTLILQNNIENANSVKVTVTPKHFRVLKYLEHCGGFLRFNMEIYDKQKGRGKSDLSTLLPFLQSVFQNKNLINSYFN